MKGMILTTNSSRHFGIETGRLDIGRFPGGEISVLLKEGVKDGDVFVIGSTEPPAENLVELLLTIDTVASHGAKSVTVIVPYFAYGKSDREKVPGQVVSARTMLNLIGAVGRDTLKIITVDLHNQKIERFSNVPLRNVTAMGELAAKFKNLTNLKVASPDKGGVERTQEFAGFLGKKEIVIIKKHRLSDTEVEIVEVSGAVLGCDVVIVDDMVESGGTIISAAEALKEKGAKDVFVAVTHMVYAAGGYLKLAEDPNIKKVITTNTIKPPVDLPSKFEVVDISALLKQVIAGGISISHV